MVRTMRNGLGGVVLSGLLVACPAFPTASAPLIFADGYESGVKYVAAGAAGIRGGNNAINTATANGFDGFFAASPNRFLVIGDVSGNLAGAPTTILSGVVYDLDPYLAGRSGLLRISFDYVFDTDGAGAPGDVFNVYVESPQAAPCFARVNPVRNSDTHRGHVTCVVPMQADNDLVFRLQESAASPQRNSAVGIDNLTVVTAVPEPAGWTLLGAGLIALGAWRRALGITSGPG